MLSDAEQRRLTEIEAQLRTDDPVFVHRFDEGEQPLEVQRRGVLATLLAAVAVTTVGIGLALRSEGMVVVGLFAIVISASMWNIDHRRT
jgi:hypothetical protein